MERASYRGLRLVGPLTDLPDSRVRQVAMPSTMAPTKDRGRSDDSPASHSRAERGISQHVEVVREDEPTRAIACGESPERRKGSGPKLHCKWVV